MARFLKMLWFLIDPYEERFFNPPEKVLEEEGAWQATEEQGWFRRRRLFPSKSSQV